MSIEFNCVPLSVSEERFFFHISRLFFFLSFFLFESTNCLTWKYSCVSSRACVYVVDLCVCSASLRPNDEWVTRNLGVRDMDHMGIGDGGGRRDKTKMKHVASQRSDFMFSLLFFRVLWLLLIRSPCSCSCFCLCHYLSLVQCE